MKFLNFIKNIFKTKPANFEVMPIFPPDFGHTIIGEGDFMKTDKTCETCKHLVGKTCLQVPALSCLDCKEKNHWEYFKIKTQEIKKALVKGGLVISPRRSGKTTALLEILAEDPSAVMIVHDYGYAGIIRKKYS